MVIGVVKWFNSQKGYGFISSEVEKKDIFVHISQLKKTGLKNLTDGQFVNYEVFADKDGMPAASDIHIM